MRAWAVIFLVCGANPAHADCTETAAAAWAALPSADQTRFGRAARVLFAEIDGKAPTEAVIAAERIPEPGIAREEEKSVVWVLRCTAARWTVVGQRSWNNNRSWDGYYDDTPGIKVLRLDHLPGSRRGFLRVEHVDLQGGVDPRYVKRSFVLLHVIRGQLVTAFSCRVREDVARGPSRAETGHARAIFYQRGQTPTIRVQERTTDNAGHARDAKLARYRLAGAVFRPLGRDLCDPRRHALPE